MAEPRGKRRVAPIKNSPTATKGKREENAENLGAIPELMRRAIALGLTGFFTTEEAIRRAIGDTLPKDWADYLTESSDRARSEFLERLSREIAGRLMDLDVAALVERLLEGRTLKFSAELRLSDDADGREQTRLRVETRREVGRD
jgi:hypothetical protein